MPGVERTGPQGRQEEVAGASHPKLRTKFAVCPKGNSELLRGLKQRGPAEDLPGRVGLGGHPVCCGALCGGCGGCC